MEDQQLQETLNTIEESSQEQDHVGAEQQVAQAAPVEKPADKNFRELRKKAEQMEAERNEYFRQLQEAKNQQPSEDISVNEDDFVEGKHLKKLHQELKSVRKELNEYKQYSAQTTAESRLKIQYPDFDNVVTPAHIETLRDQYPELAASINSNQDLYTKASAAYTLIKKLNIAPDTQYVSDRERINQNMQKPRPLSSIAPQQGDSPLSKANAFAQGLTPELKNQLLKEMQDAKKRI